MSGNATFYLGMHFRAKKEVHWYRLYMIVYIFDYILILLIVIG